MTNPFKSNQNPSARTASISLYGCVFLLTLSACVSNGGQSEQGERYAQCSYYYWLAKRMAENQNLGAETIQNIEFGSQVLHNEAIEILGVDWVTEIKQKEALKVQSMSISKEGNAIDDILNNIQRCKSELLEILEQEQ